MTITEKLAAEAAVAAVIAHRKAVAEGRICACEAMHGPYCLAEGAPHATEIRKLAA